MGKRKPRHEPGSMPTSVRVSPTCARLWEKLSIETGLSKTGIVETAIRELAKARNITDDESDDKQT